MEIYGIVDKKTKHLKRDTEGMLCLFDYERDAKIYLESLRLSYRETCEIVKAYPIWRSETDEHEKENAFDAGLRAAFNESAKKDA